MKQESRSVSRRTFLTASAAAASALAAPYFVPKSAFGASDRVLTGHIGVGGQGNANLRAFINQAVALCDVDQKRLDTALKTAADHGRTCEGYQDYRRLLDRTDIDAVVISTPDHWHAPIAIDACRAGKDVYVEKPLSLTVAEGRQMVQAARDNGRVVQTGSQQRSDEEFRRACEYVRSGRIGKLRRVLVGIPEPNHPGEPIPDSEPPAHLDYNFWLGPAPERPYNEKRLHYNFRFFWDYSGGQMTNFGAHNIDIAHWALGADDSGPLSAEGVAEFHPQAWHEVTESCRVTLRYAGDVDVIVGQRQEDIPVGVSFEGEKGKLFVARGKVTSAPAEILKEPLGDSDVKLTKSDNHHENFLACVASREKPICDVEIGHRTATACHLANIALRLSRKIEWDAAAEKIIGDDEASAMLARAWRPPWKV
jgi:predicted dehydrogenase